MPTDNIFYCQFQCYRPLGWASGIAVGPDGNAWVVNSAGFIYRYTGSYFVNVPG